MRTWVVGCVLGLGLLASPVPAVAQSTLGVGVSFLNGDGSNGPGIALDYATDFRTAEDLVIGWVVDISFNSLGVDDDVEDLLGVDGSQRVVMAQGGARVSATPGDRARVFGQVLLGIAHTSLTGDLEDLFEDVEDFCDDLDLDCGTSGTDLVVTPGFGLDYRFAERMNARAQLDFPIIGGDAATRFWFGLSWIMGAP